MRKICVMKFSLCVVLTMVMLFGATFNVLAASSTTHEHSYGSTERVERVLYTVDVVPLFRYEKDGRTYEVRRVSEWCLFYKECYCGYRGCYREGGRSRDIDVLLPLEN